MRVLRTAGRRGPRGRPRWRRVLSWLNDRLGTPYVEIGSTLYEVDLTEPLPSFEPAIPVEVSQAGQQDVALLARVRFPTSPRLAEAKATEFAKRLERGDHCIVCRSAGELASYVWVTSADWFDPEINFTIPVGATQCLGYEAFTVPSFRGQGFRLLLQIEERRLGRTLGKATLLFELHGRAESKAMRKWGPAGLRQRPIARHTTYKFFNRFSYTRVAPLVTR